MRSAAFAVRVAGLAVALGVCSATAGAGVASAWWGGVQLSIQVEKLPMGSGDLAQHVGDINPGSWSGSKSLPDLSGLMLQARTDSLFDPQVVSGGVDPRQNRAVLEGSAVATKKAAASKGASPRAAR